MKTKEFMNIRAVHSPQHDALFPVADRGRNKSSNNQHRNRAMKVKTNVKAGGGGNFGG